MNDKKYLAGLMIILVTGIAVTYYALTLTKTPEENMDITTQDQGELIIEDLIVGEGGEAVVGKTIKVHYTGTLEDGTKFDSSVDRDEPFEFTLGAGMVIQGWDQGFAGMKVGGKRKLTIPPHLGYGDTDMGTIPPESTLIFEVELLEVLETEVVE